MSNLLSAAALLRAIAVAATLLPLAPSSSVPPQSAPYGIVVMAHGGNQEWNRHVVDAVAAVDTMVPVSIAFGMADRASLATAVADLEAAGVRRIAVVRVFVSGESFLQQTEYLLGLDETVPAVLFDSSRVAGMRPVPDPAAVPPIAHDSEIAVSAHGLAGEPFVGEILAERALALSREPRRETVLVIAHGMADEDSNDRLLTALRARAATVAATAPFRAVEVVTLREDWPEQRAVAEARIRDIVAHGSEQGETIVIPFRVGGFGPYAEVLEGLDYTADGTGLLPHPRMVEWILRSARSLACFQGWDTVACAETGATR